ncbi:MAG: HEPN domain-containing protein [Anaerolineae bacterium]|nr:HEPN domain-containing protein [Anaerolineales bacterium]
MIENNPELDSYIPPELEIAIISLEKAQQDLIAVGKWLTDVDISDEIIGFHIQQAIEKSLKAILICYKIEHPRTHNLRLLVDLCQNNNIEVPSTFSQVDIFNRFAVEWRYNLLPLTNPSPLDRETAYNLATFVWNWASQLVKGSSN